MKRIVMTAIAALVATTGLTITGATPAQAQTCAFSVDRSATPDLVVGKCTKLESGFSVFRIGITCTNASGTKLTKLSGPWREAGGTSIVTCLSDAQSYISNSARFSFQ